MAYEPSINNGGAVVTVSREPVDRPPIPRGRFEVGVNGSDPLHGAERVTIAISFGEHVVTYHDVLRVSSDTDEGILVMHVDAGDVVTWEPRDD